MANGRRNRNRNPPRQVIKERTVNITELNKIEQDQHGNDIEPIWQVSQEHYKQKIFSNGDVETTHFVDGVAKPMRKTHMGDRNGGGVGEPGEIDTQSD